MDPMRDHAMRGPRHRQATDLRARGPVRGRGEWRDALLVAVLLALVALVATPGAGAAPAPAGLAPEQCRNLALVHAVPGITRGEVVALRGLMLNETSALTDRVVGDDGRSAGLIHMLPSTVEDTLRRRGLRPPSWRALVHRMKTDHPWLLGRALDHWRWLRARPLTVPSAVTAWQRGVGGLRGVDARAYWYHERWVGHVALAATCPAAGQPAPVSAVVASAAAPNKSG